MSCHMPIFQLSGFSGFPDLETGNPVLLLSGAHPGTKTDPMVPHMWAKGQSCPRFFVRLAKCNIDGAFLKKFPVQAKLSFSPYACCVHAMGGRESFLFSEASCTVHGFAWTV